MSVTPEPIQVLVIEHNQILLEGLTQLLSESPGITLVGAANSAAAGVALFKQQRPAVTIIDLQLPDAAPGDIVRRIRSLDAKTPILILAGYELDPAGAEAIAAGATAIIAKNQIASTLVSLIRRLVRPGSW